MGGGVAARDGWLVSLTKSGFWLNERHGLMGIRCWVIEEDFRSPPASESKNI